MLTVQLVLNKGMSHEEMPQILKAMFPVCKSERETLTDNLREEVKRNNVSVAYRLVCYLATFFIYFSSPFMALWLRLSPFK